MEPGFEPDPAAWYLVWLKPPVHHFIDMLFGLIVFLIALIAVVLILVVLVQSGKGGGLAGIAAGSTTQILGARQAPDVLEKLTWVLAGIFGLLCIVSNFTIDRGTQRSVVQGAQTEQTAPAPTIPAPAPAQEAPVEAAPQQ